MKRTISLILALILICTMPATFASDDAFDHDHDCDCDHEHLTRYYSYCPVCQIDTWQVENYDVTGYSCYDENDHIVYVDVYECCIECGTTWYIESIDSLEGHHWFFGMCDLCGYDPGARH